VISFEEEKRKGFNNKKKNVFAFLKKQTDED
jgi:hypothetical protein